VSEANESQPSYSVEQADIFQYQSYSHSDDMFIILISNINTNTSIFVFSREKLHDSKYSRRFPKTRGGFRGGRAGRAPPSPLKFAKHMLYNVN
jgi:hypothetical protein